MTPQPNAIPPEWQAARNILAVRLDNLGDVLVTTPAIHAIRRSLPGARITLLASPGGAQVGRLNPDIDEVIAYESPFIDPWRRLPHDSAREQALIADLRGRGFDAAVIFSSFRQSPLPAAYMCYLADIPLRLAASVDGSGSLLTTRHKHPEQMQHEVERGLGLVGAVGLTTDERDLVLRVPVQARAAIARMGLVDRSEITAKAAEVAKGYNTGTAQSALRSLRLDNSDGDSRARGPLVVVHPGCTMAARTYPWELYAQVVARLIERLDATVAVTGSADERDLVARVVGAVPAALRGSAIGLAGALEFAELCALIAAADVTITNNTGPMHIAAALKTPVAALFALTNPPEQWGPWRVPHRLLYHEVACRLCYSRACPYGHECLRLVAPDTVVGAAAELLAERGAAHEESFTPYSIFSRR